MTDNETPKNDEERGIGNAVAALGAAVFFLGLVIAVTVIIVQMYGR